jgi:hypothetical protein
MAMNASSAVSMIRRFCASLARLRADVAHDLQQRLVGRGRLGREELQDGNDPTADGHGEREPGPDPDVGGGPGAREIRVLGDVDDPGRLSGGQHPTRQPLTHAERRALGDLAERLAGGRVVDAPDGGWHHVTSPGLGQVEVADVPSGGVDDVVDDPGRHRLEGGGLVGCHCGPLQ